jgi:hypothetical protein
MNKHLTLLLLLAALSSLTSASAVNASPGAKVPADGPTITINIVVPAEGGVGGYELPVLVTISSPFEVTSVKASTEDRELALTFTTRGWTGNIPLAGVGYGEKMLTVTATDAFGNTAQAQRKYIHDVPPSLTVNAPLDETVAHSTVFIDVTCTDDGPAGCASLTASDDRQTIAVGRDSIKGFFPLTAPDGSDLRITFTALDSKGQQARLSRVVYTVTNQNLTEVETVGGHILDTQPDRILFLEDKVLKIRDRASGSDTVVTSDPAKLALFGFLTPKGAIFAGTSESILINRVYDWRDGNLLDLGPINSDTSLVVKDKYAIWNLAPPLGASALFLRDLVAGTNIQVSDRAGNIDNDVSSNGDVVYWTNEASTNYNVYRYRAGGGGKLTNDISLWNTYPRTDGINVVYRKHTPCCANQTYAIMLYSATGEVTLAPPRVQEPRPGVDYQVDGGWVAFTRMSTGPLQVWTRSPAGEETQLTFYSTGSAVEALSPLGGVVFRHEDRFYLKELDMPAVEIGATRGRYFWQGGQWFRAIGRSLFRVNTTPAPTPTLLTEPDSQQALALDAVTWKRAPFPIVTTQNFSADRRTRLMLFATNVSLAAGDNTGAIVAQAEDAQRRLYTLPVEYAGKVPLLDWLTQITVRLPDELQGAGSVWVRIYVRGEVSNRVLVSVQ